MAALPLGGSAFGTRRAYGYVELAPTNGGANVGGWTIIVMHCLQLLMSADFMSGGWLLRFA